MLLLYIYICVCAGYIGSLRLEIPFQRLRSQPVVVNVDRVFIVLSRIAEFNEKEFRRGARHAKDEAAVAAMHKDLSDNSNKAGCFVC